VKQEAGSGDKLKDVERIRMRFHVKSLFIEYNISPPDRKW